MCLPNRGPDIDRMEQYQIVKAMLCFLEVQANFTEFSVGLTEGSVACDQDKNCQNMGTNY